MRLLSRFLAVILAVQLAGQAGWAASVCDAGTSQAPAHSHHQGMPAGHHHPMPAPADHHSSCPLALCAMRSGCAPIALHVAVTAPLPTAEGFRNVAAPAASIVAAGPQSPEPPPPRA